MPDLFHPLGSAHVGPVGLAALPPDLVHGLLGEHVTVALRVEHLLVVALVPDMGHLLLVHCRHRVVVGVQSL